MSEVKTTLNEIMAHHPCVDKPMAHMIFDWQKLLKHLGKTQADDTAVDFVTILDLLGVQDACWAMRTRPDLDKLWRHFAVDCAERVKHLLTDERSINALSVAREHANGQATAKQLSVARDDARRAADAACAGSAAYYAAAATAYRAGVHAARAADAARAGEDKWQTQRLKQLLEAGEWTPVKEEVRDIDEGTLKGWIAEDEAQ